MRGGCESIVMDGANGSYSGNVVRYLPDWISGQLSVNSGLASNSPFRTPAVELSEGRFGKDVRHSNLGALGPRPKIISLQVYMI